jgi:RNA polymerase sigma-70 factor (ECF subfamily)
MRRHQQTVFRLALSILGRGFAGDAEDVAQDVFVRAHHGLRTFRGDSQFSTWLYRITFNLTVNLKERVRYRAPHLPADALAEQPATGPDPAEQVDGRRRERAVADAVEQLPEVYQSALRLHYWMGHSISEIAALLVVPENTVKSYLFRARRLLGATLRAQGVTHV